MKNVNNYTQSQIDSLIQLLGLEFSILARIDLNSDLETENRFFIFNSSKEKFIADKKLMALEMSKKIAHACHMVTSSIYSNTTKEESLHALKELLTTRFNHPYSVSALWHINSMYGVLMNLEH